MGNPSSVAARRRSPRRRKQFNRRMVKGVFCFVLVVAFAALATALPYRPAPQIDCAAPWTQLSTGCYRFHESPMTQIEAKKFCEEDQEVPARLVEIDSAEENRAIDAEMQRRNSFSQKINFWLGITDRHSEGDWVLESTGILASQTMGMVILEARTVPLLMNWKSGMMSIATANQTMGGREQHFVRKVVWLLGHSSQQVATGSTSLQDTE